MEIAIPSTTLTRSSCTPIPRRPSFSSSNSSFFNTTTTATFLTQQNRPRTRSSRALSCNCMFGLGMPELVVIAGVAALVFGPKKLPEVGRSIGKTVKSFQQAAKEFESELKKEPESAAEPPVEKPTAVGEEEKEGVKVSSTKES